MRPDPKRIINEGKRIQEQWKNRDAKLDRRLRTRQGVDLIDIPTAYNKMAEQYHSPALRDERRNIFALVTADPVPHVVPPTPEDQPYTTKMEKFLMAALQELESANGAVWNKCTSSQIDDSEGCIFLGMKRDVYSGQPEAPDETANEEALMQFAVDNTAYKKEAGISAVFDYRQPKTRTLYRKGDRWNPLAVYEIKKVDEEELILQYDLKRDKDGRLTKMPSDTGTLPDGRPTNAQSKEMRLLEVYEYWDRDWCMIVLAAPDPGFMNGNRTVPLVLDEWEHGWGRVPYFFRPAFETSEIDEEHAVESPLDALYDEVPHYNRQRTIMSNIEYMTGFAPFKLITKDGGDLILDDNGNPATVVEFVPGKFVQLAPGQDGEAIRLSPEVGIVQSGMLAAEARLKQYSLSSIAKGVSPGADTANSAVSQLRRLQQSSLQPLADNAARQAREMYKFMLARIKAETGEGVGETVYVYDKESGNVIDLSPDDIVTFNVQAKVEPETGSDALIEEKQAAELAQVGLITPIEFHERRGKENPEEYVLAQEAWKAFQTIEPSLLQELLAGLGDVQAISQLIAANQQTGDARSAIPQVMDQLKARQNGESGVMGQGSGGMPRQMGVRSPAIQPTTQPAAAMGQ